MKLDVFRMTILSLILFYSCVANTRIVKAERKNFYVSGRFLHAPDGEKVVLRGINCMNVVSDPTGATTFPEIAKTGANVVRIMWMEWGGTGDKLDVLIRNCISQQLIPLLELHDATGKWYMLDSVVNYWLRPDVVPVLQRYQQFLLLNIANEAGDGSVPMETFKNKYADNVKKMRAGGIHAPLIIDAANWGRNEEYLLANGAYLLKEDPDHNLIFSWHIWDSGIPEKRIQAAIDRSIDLKITLLIGEFAPMEVKCKCCIPYKYIMKYCQEKEIGWLAWSWGPGNSDCPHMDMTKTVAFETLFDWGLEVAMTDENSIFKTAIKPAFLKRRL